MNQKLKQEIISLDSDNRILKMLIKTRMTLLSCGAYSEKNMEKQTLQFERIGVPEWEKKIIRDSWNDTKKISHEMLKRLEKMHKLVESIYGEDINKHA